MPKIVDRVRNIKKNEIFILAVLLEKTSLTDLDGLRRIVDEIKDYLSRNDVDVSKYDVSWATFGEVLEEYDEKYEKLYIFFTRLQ